MPRRSALLLVVLALACKKDSAPKMDCAILFGNPTADTGLTLDQCRPLCACNGTTFQPPAYDDAFIQSLVDDWLPESAPPLTVDPYTQPLPADDPRQRQPNITRAKEQLNWQPRIPLREGLRHTIAYFDQLLSEESKDSRAVA